MKEMRKQERKLIITFDTTADAMAMEQFCHERGLPGRLIPVPRDISAGCGLAWCAAVEFRETLEKQLHNAGIRVSAIQECMV